MGNLDVELQRACEQIPGLIGAALLRLPAGALLCGIGDVSARRHESIALASARCFAREELSENDLTEHAFVGRDELVVLLRSQVHGELVLALVSSGQVNLMFVLSLSRMVLASLESQVGRSFQEALT